MLFRSGPLLGGVIAATLGYTVLFGTSMAFLAAGLLVLIFMVREPRTSRLTLQG